MMIRDVAVLERFVLPRFSMGCDSKSSVVLADTTTTINSRSPKHSKTRRKCGKEELKKNEGLFKASLSHGFHTLLRRFKTFSQFFVYKQDTEHKEEEMEIGFPTDVKHVTHIGLKGSTTINPVPKWEKNLKAATEILSFPSISLQQFELAMAAQSNASNLA